MSCIFLCATGSSTQHDNLVAHEYAFTNTLTLFLLIVSTATSCNFLILTWLLVSSHRKSLACLDFSVVCATDVAVLKYFPTLPIIIFFLHPSLYSHLQGIFYPVQLPSFLRVNDASGISFSLACTSSLSSIFSARLNYHVQLRMPFCVQYVSHLTQINIPLFGHMLGRFFVNKR